MYKRCSYNGWIADDSWNGFRVTSHTTMPTSSTSTATTSIVALPPAGQHSSTTWCHLNTTATTPTINTTNHPHHYRPPLLTLLLCFRTTTRPPTSPRKDPSYTKFSYNHRSTLANDVRGLAKNVLLFFDWLLSKYRLLVCESHEACHCNITLEWMFRWEGRAVERIR